MGVNEKVFVQMGPGYLNKGVTLYLKDEISNTVVSGMKTVTCTKEDKIEIAELTVCRLYTQTKSKQYRQD